MALSSNSCCFSPSNSFTQIRSNLKVSENFKMASTLFEFLVDKPKLLSSYLGIKNKILSTNFG